MGFRSGRVSYARFSVSGGPKAVTSELVQVLGGGQVRLSSGEAPSELQAAWVAGRHVLDDDFAPEIVVYGDALLFGARLETNRVPAEIRHAYRVMAEDARRRGDAGAIDRHGRLEARDEANERCREDLKSGRYRRATLLPVLWNVPRRLVLAPAFSDAKRAALGDLFEDTFDAALVPRSAGALASALLSAQGRTRDYEDLLPSPFTAPPPGAHDEEDDRDVEVPAVPWSSAGPEPKDFLGNEMLMWLWSQVVRGQAVVETPRGPVAVVIDRILETECAWSVTGKTTLRAATPTRWPESTQAFRIGKWPRKAGLTLGSSGGEHWELAFQADRFVVTSARLPELDDPPAGERELIETRLASIDELDETLVALFEAFLERRLARGWSSERSQVAEALSRAASRRSRPAAAAAEVEIVTRPAAEPAIPNGMCTAGHVAHDESDVFAPSDDMLEDPHPDPLPQAGGEPPRAGEGIQWHPGPHVPRPPLCSV